jgi:hypothetical protein
VNKVSEFHGLKERTSYSNFLKQEITNSVSINKCCKSIDVEVEELIKDIYNMANNMNM